MCRTGDVTARPILKEGRTRRTALLFSSLAILIVEESKGKISTADALYNLAYVITRRRFKYPLLGAFVKWYTDTAQSLDYTFSRWNSNGYASSISYPSPKFPLLHFTSYLFRLTSVSAQHLAQPSPFNFSHASA